MIYHTTEIGLCSLRLHVSQFSFREDLEHLPDF